MIQIVSSKTESVRSYSAVELDSFSVLQLTGAQNSVRGERVKEMVYH